MTRDLRPVTLGRFAPCGYPFPGNPRGSGSQGATSAVRSCQSEEAVLEVAAHGRHGAAVVDILEFARVFAEVVEFVHARGAADELVGESADHHRAADALGMVLLLAPLW